MMHKSKFTDKDFVEYYNQGFSDVKISKLFGCHDTTVRQRRLKLNLVANYYNLAGKKLDKNELKLAQKNICLRSIKRHLKTKKEYYKNNKESIKLKQKEYYENNKEVIRLQQKEYYENNKDITKLQVSLL